MKQHLLASLAATSTLLTFGACGGSDEREPHPDPPSTFDATFSTADEAHVARAITAAIGVDGVLAQLTVAGYAAFPSDDPAACPHFARSGDETTVTGGCTMDDGSRVEGTIVFENVQPIFGTGSYDPSKPTVIRFDDYSTTDEGGTYAYDGTLRIEPSGAQMLDLVTTLGDLTAYVHTTLTCVDQGECTASDDSWIDVDGIGAATLSGTWHFDVAAPSGSVILTGAEELVVDLDNATEQCIPYSIDGVAHAPICSE